MSTPIEVGDDPVVVQSSTTTVDENGNTTVTGYSSGGSSTYNGPVSISPGGGTAFPSGDDGGE